MDEAETVKILVRGAASCVIDGVETAVKPGCILPNGAVALEEVTYMAWDQVGPPLFDVFRGSFDVLSGIFDENACLR